MALVGRIATIEELRAIRDGVARSRDFPCTWTARGLWNASVATGISLAEIAEHADTVMVAFSKGLGAPIGAARRRHAGAHRTRLDGAQAFRRRDAAVGNRRRGGAVRHRASHRTAGTKITRTRARSLASSATPAGRAVVAPQTNIVMVDLPPGVSSGAGGRPRPRRRRLDFRMDADAHSHGDAPGRERRGLPPRGETVRRILGHNPDRSGQDGGCCAPCSGVSSAPC